MEMQITQYVVGLRTPSLNVIMELITNIAGSYVTIFVLILASIYFAKTKRRAREIMLIFLALAINLLIGVVLKEVIQRERPPISLALVHETSFSMPSNHALIAAGFYSMLFWLLARDIKNKKVRLISLTFAGLVIFLIGFSRIYLGVHWLSDVIVSYIISISINTLLLKSKFWEKVHLPYNIKV